MQVLILGCGVVGVAVGQLLQSAGHRVVGLRRTPDGIAPGFPLLAGDAADPGLYSRLAPPDMVLFAANPGVRRGRDNGLLSGARLLVSAYPHARLVYTGTTSLYADAAGQLVDEQATIAATPEAQALLAIEQPFLNHSNALVLRVTALVGPTRTFARERLRAAHGGELLIKGDLNRPFSWLHEADLASLCAQALAGKLGCGVLNAAAPHTIEPTTVRGYYTALSTDLGVQVTLRADASTQPSRVIDARRLQRMVPDFYWHGILSD